MRVLKCLDKERKKMNATGKARSMFLNVEFYERNIDPLRLSTTIMTMLTLHKTAEMHVRTETKLTTDFTNLQLTYKLHLCIIEHNITRFDFTESP